MAAAADDSRAALVCYAAIATMCFSIAYCPSNLLRSAASALCFFAVNAIAIIFLILYFPEAAPTSPSSADPFGSPNSNGNGWPSQRPFRAFQDPMLRPWPNTGAESYGMEVPPPPEEEEEVFKDKKVVHVETLRAQPPRRTCGDAAGRASTTRAASAELRQADLSENRRRRQRRSSVTAPLESGMDDDIFSEASVIAPGADRGGDRREHYSLPSAAPAPTYTMHPSSPSAPPAPAEWHEDESSENRRRRSPPAPAEWQQDESSENRRRRSPPVVLFMELGMLDDLDGEEFRQLVEAFVAEQLDALFEYKESRAAAGEGDGPADQGQSVGDVDVEPIAPPAPACCQRRHAHAPSVERAAGIDAVEVTCRATRTMRMFCSPRVNKAALLLASAKPQQER